MPNQKQTSARRLKMADRAQQQMGIHFPDYPDVMLWRRKSNDGFTTLPRTMPLVMQAVDALSKGQPAGHTLFCLWARSPDHPLVTIENPATFASEAGFFGERAVDTWRRRMRQLASLGLIETQHGPSGDFHYVLLLNPNVAVERLNDQKKVSAGLYARFLDRLVDVGGFGEIEAYRAHKAAQAQKSPTPDSGKAPATAPAPAKKKAKARRQPSPAGAPQ